MANWEQNLSQLLKREEELLTELKNCSDQKTGVLVKGDVDGLDRIVNKEQTLTLRLQAAEKQRQMLLKKNGMSGKKLRDICSVADEQYKEILVSQLESLNEIIDKLKDKNEFNGELTKSRLEFYGKMRALISKPVSGYDSKDASAELANKRLIDKRI